MDDLLSLQDRIQHALDALPLLSSDEITSLSDDSCPICLMPFAAIISETRSVPEHGVTKLIGCGHVFCRKDLSEWIRGQHGSCPTCRHIFLNIKPSSESDDESSDGGEYIPPEDPEDEDMYNDIDAFSDAGTEYEGDDMESGFGFSFGYGHGYGFHIWGEEEPMDDSSDEEDDDGEYDDRYGGREGSDYAVSTSSDGERDPIPMEDPSQVDFRSGRDVGELVGV
ncbi:hypothetical protein AMATHDRAFT_156087 [Amanita thiersii Skay4041]|uniref:RING-type domain-containing protein n=1 Tax=Amanita thiersii Skay4041 TaxID=703135 RepID=A0A2A9N8K9_9AGAR|nr:hypothetical protein AMATHDRAFT_156087 [Amanita thiersii Skay4041]